MDVVDEFYHAIIFSFTSEEIVKILQELKIQKENQIVLLKEKIIKYEEKEGHMKLGINPYPPSKKFFPPVLQVIIRL
ncbi:hypothetical protein NDK43_17845 [Neobacillus pocheonensis]|uniref:Uncharacterized protein n=1 Tax=Neobacillus pocheonensis TaxID=363869 RepID=A0ABT0WEF0_9BACI|nr:hypothetical protein [Neobacillus pocheonensis]